MAKPKQRPEGRVIQDALRIKGLSARQAAKEAHISEARWRQIVNGYAPAGAGQTVEVVGPDPTLARMARVAGVTPQQLQDAGRPDAAETLRTLIGMQAESEWQSVGTALERLLRMRDQLDDVIALLRAAPAPTGGVTGAAPGVEVGEPDA